MLIQSWLHAAKAASAPPFGCWQMRRRNATILRFWQDAFMNSGCNPACVQQWLGHESLATTQKYLEPPKETEKGAGEDEDAVLTPPRGAPGF